MGKTKTAFVSEVGENLPTRAGKNKEKHESAKKGKEEKIHIAGLKGGQRVKMVEAAPTEEAPIIEEGTDVEKAEGHRGPERAKRVERIRGKKYKEAKRKIDREKLYKLSEAIKLVKDASFSKFDGTMELHLVVKKAGTTAQVALPHSAGREKKVEMASDATIKKLQSGKIDFDILVATPDLMPKLVPFAKVLGPKGLMPNPKNGTLISDPKKAKGFSAGTLTLKTEKEAPLIHTVIGKNSQADKEISENAEAIFKALGGEKQIVRAFLKSTMSPSVKLQIG